MFERGIVTEQKKRKFSVIITMDDGTVERGTVSGAAASLADVLAADGAFLEFTGARGDTSYYGKSALRRIELAEMPSADQLRDRERAVQANNPYQILKVSPDIDEAGLSDAYRKLSKVYHPDRLTGLDMPQEIVDYAAAMQRRINMAFDEIRAILKRNAEAAAKPKAEPVFESRPGRAGRDAAAKPARAETAFGSRPAWARQAS